MTEYEFPEASRVTLRESVVERLQNGILTGAIPQGTHLAEIELSAALDVSRGTLREAVRQLQQQGILVQDHRGRVSVTKLAKHDVEDLFEVRIGLESIAMAQICKRPDHELAARNLDAPLDAMRAATGDLINGIRADMLFHESFCELAENAPLLHTWRSISGLIRLAMVAAGPNSAHDNMRADRHAPIVEFIESGDAAAGVAFVEAHMRSALSELIGRMTDPEGPV